MTIKGKKKRRRKKKTRQVICDNCSKEGMEYLHLLARTTKKKIDRFSELLKGYLKQAEKNTIKRLQYIVASYIVKVPLQCSRSLECQNAGRL